jgi:ATP-dependent protease ClpP protease subunit
MTVNFRLQKKDDKKAELVIYDVIGAGFFGGISAKEVVDQLKAMGEVEEINVRINSPGGSAFDGIAIYNALERNSAKKIVDVDAVAASSAALVAMAASPGQLRIAANAEMMIHNGAAFVDGDKNDLNKMIERLRSLDDMQASTFAKRMKVSKQEIMSMMDAETWFTADAAVKAGLADVVTGEMNIAACASELYSKFKNVPADLAAQLKKGDSEMTEQEIQAKVDASLKSAIEPIHAEHKSEIEKLEAKHAAEIKALGKKEPEKNGVEIKTETQIRAEEGARSVELEALYDRTGIKDKSVLENWFKNGVSVVEAKAQVADMLIKQNKLVEGEGGDQGTKEKAAEMKARAEYREHPKLHATLGYATEDDYAKWRKEQIAAESAA